MEFYWCKSKDWCLRLITKNIPCLCKTGCKIFHILGPNHQIIIGLPVSVSLMLLYDVLCRFRSDISLKPKYCIAWFLFSYTFILLCLYLRDPYKKPPVWTILPTDDGLFKEILQINICVCFTTLSILEMLPDFIFFPNDIGL